MFLTSNAFKVVTLSLRIINVRYFPLIENCESQLLWMNKVMHRSLLSLIDFKRKLDWNLAKL